MFLIWKKMDIIRFCDYPNCDKFVNLKLRRSAEARKTTLFRLPKKNKARRRQWLKLLKIKLSPDESLFICNNHFDVKYLRASERRVVLKRNAIPMEFVEEKPSPQLVSKATNTTHHYQQDDNDVYHQCTSSRTTPVDLSNFFIATCEKETQTTEELNQTFSHNIQSGNLKCGEVFLSSSCVGALSISCSFCGIKTSIEEFFTTHFETHRSNADDDGQQHNNSTTNVTTKLDPRLADHSYCYRHEQQNVQPRNGKTAMTCDKLMQKKVLKRIQPGHTHKVKKIKKDKQKFLCSMCGYTCALKRYLNLHERSFHAGKKSYPCGVCLQRFKTKYALKRHGIITSHHLPR